MWPLSLSVIKPVIVTCSVCADLTGSSSPKHMENLNVLRGRSPTGPVGRQKTQWGKGEVLEMAAAEALLQRTMTSELLQKGSLMTVKVATSSNWTQGQILLRDRRRKRLVQVAALS